MFRFKEWPAKPYTISAVDVKRLLVTSPRRLTRDEMAPEYYSDPDGFETYRMDGAILVVYPKAERRGVIYPDGAGYGIVQPDRFDQHPLEHGLVGSPNDATNSGD